MSQPVISVVLGSYNRLSFLKLAIKSIREELANLALPSEIIVIDGGSSDGSTKWLIAQKDIITIIQHNRGTWNNKPINRRSWGYFMNLGFKCAQGKYICMVSDDCLIIPNAIKNGFTLFEEKLTAGEKIGALAFYWRNVPFFYSNWAKEKTYNVLYTYNIPYVNHGMYLRSALEEIHYIDEDSYFFYSADADLCLRLHQKGYLCIESPDSYIEHYFHASPSLKKKNSEHPDETIFCQKWTRELKWSIDKHPYSLNGKEFHDVHRTADKFKNVHFTNFEYWGTFIKDVAKNKFRKIAKKRVT